MLSQDPGITIYEFERLLEQVSPNAQQHAYYFARKSLRAAIYYLRTVLSGYQIAVRPVKPIIW